MIVSEKEYNEMVKAQRNAEYLAMLDRSYKQLENGETISFSMEELQAIESDDWKPTEKVLNWMERMKHRNIVPDIPDGLMSTNGGTACAKITRSTATKSS